MNHKVPASNKLQNTRQETPTANSDSTLLQNTQNRQPNAHYLISPSNQNTTQEKVFLDLNEIELNIPTYEEEAFDGYNIFVLEDEKTLPPLRGLIVTDMTGELLNNKLPISFPPDVWVFHVEFINSTHLLYGTKDGAHLWNLYNNTAMKLGIYGHHEYEYNPNSDTFFTLIAYIIEIEDERYEFDIIAEYNTKGQLVWELDTRSFISHTQWCPFKDSISDEEGTYRDLLHSNTIFFDSEEEIIYYNARNLNTFYKINHKTRQVLWGLGEYGNFTLYDKNGKPKHNLFYHSHSVEKVDQNTFIMFDNDLHNQTNNENKRSQMLEITINETTMTANVSWSWVAPPEYWSVGYGDADRLPNGNRLGVFGWGWHIVNGTNAIGARLVEVTEEGEIVWELNIPNDIGNTVYSVYRMERFHLSPILNTPPDINGLETDNLTLSWQTRYNFRAKRRMQGNYTFILNGVTIENGTHVFDKFWRPTNCTINLGRLESGTYNLTLLLTDEGGHPTVDSITITIKKVFLERECPLSIEQGQDGTLIRWRGDTIDSVSAIIIINNEIYNSFAWDGEDITLDLNLFDTGAYFITIQLFYEMKLLYSESFTVNIYPASIPTINESPYDSVITWNESKKLTWELYDQFPASWHIFVNNTNMDSGIWESPYYQLTWQIPILNEGRHNITLLAIDVANQQTINTIWLTVIPPNPPLVMVSLNQTVFQWGVTPTNLQWKVYGATQFKLWRNGTIIDEGDVISTKVNVPIENWEDEDWNPGVYNLTIQVTNVDNVKTTHTTWIQVEVDVGDAYADSIEISLSMWFREGENVLGPPDGKFARLFPGYGNGHLTLDMGQGEEIRNKANNDFMISARGGKYAILIGNNLSTSIIIPSQESAFVLLGEGVGNTTFDLAVIDFEQARYIQIVYISGDDVEIDAVEAFYYNVPLQPNLDSDQWYFPVFGGFIAISITIVVCIRKRKKIV